MKPPTAADIDPKFKQHLNGLVEKLRSRFYLDEYCWDISYHANGIPGASGAAASIRVDTTYLNFTINVGPRLLEYWNKGCFWLVGETIVHELAHTVTEPLYEIACFAKSPANSAWIEKIREQQTQRVAVIVMGLLPKGWFEPQPRRGGVKPPKG